MYKQLVKTQKSINANAGHPTDELAGIFQFQVTSKSGVPLSDMLHEIRKAIKEFESRGVTDDDIEKFKNAQLARMVYELESVSGKVSKLAAYETFTGNPNYIKTEIEQINKLSKQDVLRVFEQYIKNKPMVILSVATKNDENNKAAPDNYTIDTKEYKAPDYGYAKLAYKKPKDNFDRSKMPAAGPNPVVKVPNYIKMSIENMNVMYAFSDEIPTVSLTIGLKGGRLAEQSMLNKAGLSSVVAKMLEEDTKFHTDEEISIMLEKLGSSISINSQFDEIEIQVRSLRSKIGETVSIVLERLMNPKFEQSGLDRIKNQMIENIKNSKTRAAVVASQTYNTMLYGTNNILGLPSSGNEKTVQNIALEDVERYYKQYINRFNANLIIVGALNKSEALGIVSKFTQLPSKEVKLPPVSEVKTKSTPNTVYVVNIPKAAQTEFRIGYVTELLYDATGEYYKAGLMNYPLGGAFNSRINLNLREDKGWTYGARSNFSGSQYTGTYTFSSGILAAATDSALSEVLREIRAYADNGIKDDELSFLKNAISQSEARKYETGFQKAGFLSNILTYNLPADFVEQQTAILKSINKSEINQLAKKWLNMNKMNILLVGDLERIKPGIEKLGYQVIEIDADGMRRTDRCLK
jgi:Predicted Zn-dependent peptidases